METVTKKGKLAGRVSLTLAAGMFGAVPMAQGAPVLDAVVSGGADINQTAGLTDITSENLNNVINWKTFSVAEDEKVRFDNGQQVNNYLNLVTGAQTSQIDGAVEGGKNVYLVNPNGINIGENADISVGNLYLSTRPLSEVDIDAVDANGNMSPLQSTSVNMKEDVVNLGNIRANKVVIEGEKIVVMDAADVKDEDGKTNTDVKLTANSTVEVGHEEDDTSNTIDSYDITAKKTYDSTKINQSNAQRLLFSSDANKADDTETNESTETSETTSRQTGAKKTASTLTLSANAGGSSDNETVTETNDSAKNTKKTMPTLNLLGAADTGTGGETVLDHNSTQTKTDDPDYPGNGMEGSYILSEDIDFGGGTIKAAGTYGTPFKGHFNGQYHTVSNFTVAGGLFGYTDNDATIENVGIRNATINPLAINGKSYAGGIVAFANNTVVKNVFNAGGTVNSGAGAGRTGGIVGYAKGSKIDSAYNTSTIGGGGAGIIGGVYGGTVVTDVYNTGIATYGVYVETENGVTVKNAYTTKGDVGTTSNGNFSNLYKISGNNATVFKNATNYGDAKHYQSYDFLSIDDTIGGKNTKWRIYEGQSLPLLRSFLTAKGTVKVNMTSTDTKVTADSNGDLSKTYDKNAVPLSFGTAQFTNDVHSDSSVNSDLIKIDTNNYTDVSWYKDGSGTEHYDLPRAAAYGDQNGYDIVGGNLTIKQRLLGVDADSAHGSFSKVYDGKSETTYSATDIFKALAAQPNSDVGLIDGDDVRVGGTLLVNYGRKDVTQSTNVSLTPTNLTLEQNQRNYKLDGSWTTGSPITQVKDANDNMVDITAEIRPRSLIINDPEMEANKVYDGTDVVTNINYAKDNETGGTTTETIDVTTDAGREKIGEVFKLNESYNEVVKGDEGLLGNKLHGIAPDPTPETPSPTPEDVKVVLNDANALTYADKNVGADKLVNIGGLALSGDDAKNYQLVQIGANNTVNVIYRGTSDWADGSDAAHSAVTNGSYSATGTITPKVISATDYKWSSDGTNTEAKLNTAQREYDATTVYSDANGKLVFTNNGNETSGTLGGHDVSSDKMGIITVDGTKDNVKFTVQSANFIGDNGSVTPNATLNTEASNYATGVKYTITVSGDDAKNYSFEPNAGVGDALKNDSATPYQVTGTGVIDQRALWLTVGNTEVAKDYDGNANVLNNGSTTLAEITNVDSTGGKYVGYTADASNNNNAHKLFDDGVKLTITGTYGAGIDNSTVAGKDVAWKSGTTDYTLLTNVDNKHITYTTALSGGTDNAAGNYVVYQHTNGSADNGTQTETFSSTLGKINPASITAVDFDSVDKDFDNSKAVTDKTAITITNATGVVTGESVLKVDTDKIGGEYESEHVKWKNGTTSYTPDDVDDQTVTYNPSGIVFKGDTPRNYILNVTDASGVGKINPITVNSFTLDKDGSITKVYDGNANVYGDNATTHHTTSADGKGTTNYVYNLYHEFNNGEKIFFDYDIAGAVYATKDSKNSTAQNVTYTIGNIAKNTADSAFHDYAVDTSNGITINNAAATVNGSNWDTTFANWGTITPRPVTVELGEKPTKDYDNSTAYDASGDSVLTFKPDASLGNNASAIVGSDSNTSTVAYTDKNAGDNKNVTYTVSIKTGDPTNYDVTDPEGNALMFATSGDNQQATYNKNDYGIIKQRELTVNFADVSKTYDGTSKVTNTGTDVINPTVGNLITGANAEAQDDVIKFTDVSGTYGVKTGDNFTPTEHVNANSAKYTGIELLSDNYKLTLDKDDPTGTTYTAYGAGKINPLQITADDLNNLKLDKDDSITKVYDGSPNVYGNGATLQHKTADSGTDGKGTTAYVYNLYKTLGTGDDAPKIYFDYTIDSATYADKNVALDASGDPMGKNVTYTLTSINPLPYTDSRGASYQDYVIATGVAPTATYTFNNWGTITPKSITAEVTGKPEKTYDATNTVTSPDTYFKLNDVVSGDNYTTTGEYNDKNAGIKNVTYTVNLGANKDNYKIESVSVASGVAPYDGTTIEATQNGYAFTAANGGKIDKANLTVTFDNKNKPYDGTSKVLNPTATVTGLQGRDATKHPSINTDLTNAADSSGNKYITGTYGKSDNGTGSDFAADANVSYAADDTTILNKWINYTGIDSALASLGDNLANNYNIAASVLYSPDDAKGMITKQVIDKLLEKWTGNITKVYDAETTLSDASKELYKLYAVSNNNEETEFTTFKLAANYDDKNAANNKGVTYNVSGLDISGLGRNFDITDNDVQALLNQYSSADGVTKTLAEYNTANNTNVTATITPLEVTGTAAQNDKIYDGTTDADKSKFTIDQTVRDVMAKDGTTPTVNAVYANGQNANADKDGNLLANAAAGTVNYTVGLTGDANVGSNYTLNNDYTGAGNIKQRKVYVDVAGTTEKVYDATTAINADNAKANVTFTPRALDATNQTGVIAGDEANFKITTTNLGGKYDSPDVQYDSAGEVTTQNVNYTGLNVSNNNYVLVNDNDEATDKATGQGKITPRRIKATLAQSSNLDREYDGTANVSEKYRLQNVNFAVDNPADATAYNTAEVDAAPSNNGYNKTITVKWNAMDDEGNPISNIINVELAKAVYVDSEGNEVKNANDGQVLGVDYVLGWDDKNYKLVPVNLNGAGTISRRTIKIDEAGITQASKTYDGTDIVSSDDAAKNLKPAFVNAGNGDKGDSSTAIVAGDDLGISTVQTTTTVTPVLDDEGHQLYDEDNNPITVTTTETVDRARYQPVENAHVQKIKTVEQQATDKDGNPLYEADGVTPIMETVKVQKQDDQGNPLFDVNGYPVYEYEDVMETVTVTDDEGNETTITRPVTRTFDGKDAWYNETMEKSRQIQHDVIYNFTINNPNYRLVKEVTDSEGNTTLEDIGTETNRAEVTGKGVIERAPLTARATHVSARSDNVPTTFSGSVSGWQGTDSGDGFTWQRGGATGSTENGTYYPIYGWYGGDKTGAYGLNYYFEQAPENEKALYVQRISSGGGSITPTPTPEPEPVVEPTPAPTPTPTPAPSPAPAPSGSGSSMAFPRTETVTKSVPTSTPAAAPTVTPSVTPSATPAATTPTSTAAVTPTVTPAAEPAATATVQPAATPQVASEATTAAVAVEASEPAAVIVPVNDDVAAITNFRPDNTSYLQASHDFSGSYDGNGSMNITSTGSNIGKYDSASDVTTVADGGEVNSNLNSTLTESGSDPSGMTLESDGANVGSNNASTRSGKNDNGDMSVTSNGANVNSNNASTRSGKNDDGDMSVTSDGANVNSNNASTRSGKNDSGDMSVTSDGANVNSNNASTRSSKNGSSNNRGLNFGSSGENYSRRSSDKSNSSARIDNRGDQNSGVRITSERASKDRMASINIDVESDNVQNEAEADELELERRRRRAAAQQQNRYKINLISTNQGVNLNFNQQSA